MHTHTPTRQKTRSWGCEDAADQGAPFRGCTQSLVLAAGARQQQANARAELDGWRGWRVDLRVLVDSPARQAKHETPAHSSARSALV